MRHRVRNNHLGRKTAHRKALLSHLACDLINNKRIVTTLAKAKALRIYVEPIITKSKTNTTHQRRNVFSILQDKHAVAELFGDVSAKIGNRPGGYTRIIKLGARQGDAAELAMIELVDYNTIYSNKEDGKPKRKRTRRSGARKKATTSETQTEDKAADSSSTEKKHTQDEKVVDETKVENKVEETKVENEVAEAKDEEKADKAKDEKVADKPKSEKEEKQATSETKSKKSEDEKTASAKPKDDANKKEASKKKEDTDGTDEAKKSDA